MKPNILKHNTVGLIPAAGTASRIAPLPCSKEIFPVGFGDVESNVGRRPKSGCHYLLEKFKCAEISNVYMVIRNGKWDIPAYLGDGHQFGVNIAYLLARYPYGVPFSLDQAYPYIRKKTVALGFPDILFQPNDVFKKLIDRQNESCSDVVLALKKTDSPSKCDMLEFDDRGRICRLVIKPACSRLNFTWAAAVWRPGFTQLMHEYLDDMLSRFADKMPQDNWGAPVEVHVGEVLQAAIDQGMAVDYVKFPDGRCVDFGTPDYLSKCFAKR